MTPNQSPEPNKKLLMDILLPIVVALIVVAAASYGTYALFTAGQLFQGPWR